MEEYKREGLKQFDEAAESYFENDAARTRSLRAEMMEGVTKATNKLIDQGRITEDQQSLFIAQQSEIMGGMLDIPISGPILAAVSINANLLKFIKQCG